ESDARIRRNRRGNGGSWTVFPRVGEMKLVQTGGGDRAEQVHVQHADFRRPLDAVGGIAVRGDVERLVRVLRVVEVVRHGEAAGTGEVPVELYERCVVVDRVVDRLALVLAAPRPEKIEQRHPLTIGAAANQRLGGGKGRGRD